jgi:hypothetical protein
VSRYRKIDTRIWNDDKFRSLSQEGRYFFMYLLTSPHSTAWGAYVIDDLYIQADLGFSQQKINNLWRELDSAGGHSLVLRDKNTRLVAFPNWFKYNTPENKKTLIACGRGVAALPKSAALLRFCEISEAVSEQLANLHLTQLVSEQLANESLPVREKLDDEHGALSTEQGALNTEQDSNGRGLLK